MGKKRVRTVGNHDSVDWTTRRRLNDVSLQTSVNLTLGWSAQISGDYRPSAKMLSWAAEVLQDDRRDELSTGTGQLGSVASRAWLAWSLAELGEFAEAMAQSKEALRIASELDNPGDLVYAYRIVGLVSLRLGAISHAIPPLERALELCRTAQVRNFFDITAANLGYAYALSGRIPEG